MKIAVIYYSATGTNYQLAKWAAQGAEAEGATVRLLKLKETAPTEAIASNPAWLAHRTETSEIPEITHEDLIWADGLIFSFPTRFGNIPSQLSNFLDTCGGIWFAGKLTNKVVSAMTSAGNPHGGQEATLLSFYVTMFHWGTIIASPGFTHDAVYKAGGNPYGTTATAGPDGILNDAQDAAIHQGQRTAQVTRYIKIGLETTK